MTKEYKFKIVLLGDFCVGKTSLIRKFVFNLFDDKYLTTIGVSITKKQFSPIYKKKAFEVTLLIWDINGDNGYSKITPQYLMGASAAILVADVTRQETMDNLAGHINSYLNKNPQGKILIALNKCDLIENEKTQEYFRQVHSHFDQKICDVFITSAKTGTNVENMFECITQRILENGNYEL